MEWISVDERLPDKAGNYLVVQDKRARGGYCFVDFMIFTGASWMLSSFDGEITHWQPRPELPAGCLGFDEWVDMGGEALAIELEADNGMD